MTLELPWMRSNDQWQLWADLMLIWAISQVLRPDNTIVIKGRRPTAVANDSIQTDFIAAGVAAVVACLWSLSSGASPLLIVIMFGVSFLAPAVRRWLLFKGRLDPLPFWELLNPVLAAIALGFAIGGGGQLQFNFLLEADIESAARLKVIVIVTSFLLVTRGGTHFVKAVCATCSVLPGLRAATTSSPEVAGDNQSAEAAMLQRGLEHLNQARIGLGRRLGNLERILMLIFVLAGNYEAIGIVLAAKGLIRSREFDDRDFTEYFLLGSLASILYAIIVGEMARLLCA